ncbi:MAG: ATP-binding protein, partial [Bacilli bacterium]|nr:ATP-binding protein [Bacilli bacterium]
RFFREDRARSRITGGNGLGLSIAKTLIQLHHGKILVEKNNPKGSRFIINLPKIK